MAGDKIEIEFPHEFGAFGRPIRVQRHIDSGHQYGDFVSASYTLTLEDWDGSVSLYEGKQYLDNNIISGN